MAEGHAAVHSCQAVHFATNCTGKPKVGLPVQSRYQTVTSSVSSESSGR